MYTVIVILCKTEVYIVGMACVAVVFGKTSVVFGKISCMFLDLASFVQDEAITMLWQKGALVCNPSVV